MPVYTCECAVCGKKEDIFRLIGERDNDLPVCHGPMARVMCPSQPMPDIQPYKTVAVDKETGKTCVINSRKQHREFLKRNEYTEVGSDKSIYKKREQRGSYVSKGEISRIMNQLRK